MDLTFKSEDGTFNCRACGIILRENRLLAMRDTPDDHYYLPGGRVALGETAEKAVLRELREELEAEASIIRPLWLNQSFFTLDGTLQRFHELCFYFLLDIRGTWLEETGETFSYREGNRTREFSWIPFSELKHTYFYPQFLKTAIFHLPEHLTLRTEEEPLYRAVTAEELKPELFESLDRFQEVTRCWRRENGAWVIKPVSFTENWGRKEHEFVAWCLQRTLSTGGAVYGAFAGEKLKGIVSVEAAPLGSRQQYLEISCLHVSRELRGQGIGRTLFSLAKAFAKEKGAKKLYISSHSSVESQAFYKAMGCREAEEYDPERVQREPCDCQIECRL